MGSNATKSSPVADTPRTERDDENRTKKQKGAHKGTVGKKGKPPPKPLDESNCKSQLVKLHGTEFKIMDDIALQVPPEFLLRSFWEIVEFLIVTPDGDVVTDICKIRALFRWIVSYDILNIDTDLIPPDGSPLEHFLNVQCELGDHAHLFYSLCSLADIPCVIINGMTKSALYEVGDELDREKMASQWNAVYIDGSWRLVDCFWASVSVDERNTIDKIIVTKKGKVKRASENGEGPVPFNEFYFFVDPDQLLWTHLADDPEWQLVKTPISEEEFQNMVYVREQFHLLEMKFIGNCKHCVLESKGEPIEIIYSLPRSRSKHYKFAYTLSQSRTQIESDRPVDLLLERFVFFEHKDDTLKMTIRLPLTGKFQLDIFASDLKVSLSYKLICTYIIICEEKHENILPYPDCPDLGWGVSPHAEEAGITLVENIEGGRIVTKSGEIELKFDVSDIPFLSHTLKNVLINEALLSKYSLARRDKEKYIVNIKLPREGEYALKIYADGIEKLDKHLPKDILTFLIHFDNPSKTNEPFPNVAGGSLGTKPYAEKFGVDVLSYQNGIVKAWGGKTRLEFETNMKDVKLMCDLCGFDRESSSRSSVEVHNVQGHWVFDLDLPVPGDYSMNILACMEEDSTNLYEIQSYMVTSVVSDVKRVKFEDDGEIDDIITATIRTSEENIKIPIPNGEDNEKVFTRISRKDGKDGENGTRPSVLTVDDIFDITLKEDGEYILDVWSQDNANTLAAVARFTICRRPSIESFSDDIDALIQTLKPQEEEIDEEVIEGSENETYVLEDDNEECEVKSEDFEEYDDVFIDNDDAKEEKKDEEGSNYEFNSNHENDSPEKGSEKRPDTVEVIGVTIINEKTTDVIGVTRGNENKSYDKRHETSPDVEDAIYVRTTQGDKTNTVKLLRKDVGENATTNGGEKSPDAGDHIAVTVIGKRTTKGNKPNTQKIQQKDVHKKAAKKVNEKSPDTGEVSGVRKSHGSDSPETFGERSPDPGVVIGVTVLDKKAKTENNTSTMNKRQKDAATTTNDLFENKETTFTEQKRVRKTDTDSLNQQYPIRKNEDKEETMTTSALTHVPELKRVCETDTESLEQRSPKSREQRAESITTSAFGLVAAHVISDDKVNDDVIDMFDDSVSLRSTNESVSIMADIDESKLDEESKERHRIARRRMVIRKLRKAIKDKKLKDIVDTFEQYKSTKPHPNDELLRETRKIINHMKAKENLINATLSKDPDILKDAITRAQKYNYNMSLTVQILMASRILERLNRMRKVQMTVLEMNQNAVTEMKKYTNPPNGVHQTLGATFLLLGENATVVKNWKQCHSILFKTGKDNIMRKITQFDPKEVSPSIAYSAKKILEPFDVIQIRDVSKGAAAFYTWATNMVQEVESYRSSLRKSGKTSARHVGPRSANMLPHSARKENTLVIKI